jgi:hypothetical protein
VTGSVKKFRFDGFTSFVAFGVEAVPISNRRHFRAVGVSSEKRQKKFKSMVWWHATLRSLRVFVVRNPTE